MNYRKHIIILYKMRTHTFIKAAMLAVAVGIVSSCKKKIEFT